MKGFILTGSLLTALVINGDKMHYNREKSIVVIEGNVRARGENFEIRCNRAIEKNKSYSLYGNIYAIITQEEGVIYAYADEARYMDRIELYKEAKVVYTSNIKSTATADSIFITTHTIKLTGDVRMYVNQRDSYIYIESDTAEIWKDFSGSYRGNVKISANKPENITLRADEAEIKSGMITAKNSTLIME